MNEQEIDAQRIILESMTPRELDLEHTRMFGQPPADAAARGDLIDSMLSKLKQNPATRNRP